MTLTHNPNEPFEMPLDIPTRACEFKRKWEGDWEPGKWHAWGTDYEEFETGPGMYPVGIIEDSTGCIHSIYAELIRMEKP